MTIEDYKLYCEVVKYRFRGHCPYTDLKCESFDCANCEVEIEERKWIEESGV
jgi:hypothetical protein